MSRPSEELLEPSHGSEAALEEACAHYRSGEWTLIAWQEGDEVLACAGAERLDSETIGIRSIAVAPAWRNRGLGRTLLDALVSLRGELDYQNQVRDHAADESDRPDKLLQQRLIRLNGIRLGSRCRCTRGFRRPCSALTALHLCTLPHRCRSRSRDCDPRIRNKSASLFLVGRRYHWLPYAARGGAPEG
jgi:GNAT superfamily N-acetyltransferase